MQRLQSVTMPTGSRPPSMLRSLPAASTHVSTYPRPTTRRQHDVPETGKSVRPPHSRLPASHNRGKEDQENFFKDALSACRPAGRYRVTTTAQAPPIDHPQDVLVFPTHSLPPVSTRDTRQTRRSKREPFPYARTSPLPHTQLCWRHGRHWCLCARASPRQGWPSKRRTEQVGKLRLCGLLSLTTDGWLRGQRARITDPSTTPVLLFLMLSLRLLLVLGAETGTAPRSSNRTHSTTPTNAAPSLRRRRKRRRQCSPP